MQIRKHLFPFVLLTLSVISGIVLPLHAQKVPSDFVLVLDPGHGGEDAGACAFGRREKDINLEVAQLVRDLIRQTYPEISVYMTRTKDIFIGLNERAKYANRKKANLFISIHTNSAESSQASGTETYVLGLSRAKENLRVAQKENQAILLEADYEETYEGFDPNSTESYIIFEMMQDVHLNTSIQLAQEVQRAFSQINRGDRSVRQAGFLVLRATSMPSILIELGFISNRNESAYLGSSTGQRELAQAIVSGFGRYYQSYLKSIGAKSTSQSKSKSKKEQDATTCDTATKQTHTTSSTQESESQDYSGVYYRVQIAATREALEITDRQFHQLSDIQREKRGKLYLFTTHHCNTLTEARQAMRKLEKKYPGCYIIEYKDGKRVREIY